MPSTQTQLGSTHLGLAVTQHQHERSQTEGPKWEIAQSPFILYWQSRGSFRRRVSALVRRDRGTELEYRKAQNMRENSGSRLDCKITADWTVRLQQTVKWLVRCWHLCPLPCPPSWQTPGQGRQLHRSNRNSCQHCDRTLTTWWVWARAGTAEELSDDW